MFKQASKWDFVHFKTKIEVFLKTPIIIILKGLHKNFSWAHF